MFPAVTEAEIAEARADAAALMQDTCVVSRSTGRAVQDETTGKESAVFAEVMTSMCRVQVTGTAAAGSLQLGRAEAGGAFETVARAILVLPYDTVGVAVDDLVEITAIGPGTMPTNLGRKFRVVGSNPKTHATALRLQIEDVL